MPDQYITRLPLPHDDSITLLDAVNDKKIVTLIIGNRYHHVQSMILGADLVGSELLLGECFPSLGTEHQESLLNQPCWLKIKSHNRYLFVKILLSSATLYSQVFTILDSYWSMNQRWNSRVQFGARSGPNLRIFHEKEGFQNGWLKDLSAQGGCLELYGAQSKDLFNKRQTLTLELSFHHEFKPELAIQILEKHFKRKPCCYTQIRFKFKKIGDIVYTQLDEFVDAYLEQETSIAS